MPVRVVTIEVPDEGRIWGYTANHEKLKAWVDIYHKSEHGVILLDCDMLVLRDPRQELSDLVQYFGVCRREPGAYQAFNGGLIVAKKSPVTDQFFNRWLDIDRRMYTQDHRLHAKYREKYSGMNQASFGYLHDHHETRNVTFIPPTYNWCPLENPAWNSAAIVHCKQPFRHWLSGHAAPTTRAGRELLARYLQEETTL
jgi:hypothetical protein